MFTSPDTRGFLILISMPDVESSMDTYHYATEGCVMSIVFILSIYKEWINEIISSLANKARYLDLNSVSVSVSV